MANKEDAFVEVEVPETVKAPEPQKPRKAKRSSGPKTVKVRVVLTNPFGRPGDVLDLRVANPNVRHMLETGVLVEV